MKFLNKMAKVAAFAFLASTTLFMAGYHVFAAGEYATISPTYWQNTNSFEKYKIRKADELSYIIQTVDRSGAYIDYLKINVTTGAEGGCYVIKDLSENGIYKVIGSLSKTSVDGVKHRIYELQSGSGISDGTVMAKMTDVQDGRWIVIPFSPDGCPLIAQSKTIEGYRRGVMKDYYFVRHGNEIKSSVNTELTISPDIREVVFLLAATVLN